MNLEQQHTLPAVSPTQLWPLLLDPNELIKAIPYAQMLVFLTPRERALLHLRLHLGEAAVQDLRVELRYHKYQPPEQLGFRFLILGQNGTDSLMGEGSIRLSPSGDSDTAAQYRLTLTHATGIFDHLGEALLGTACRAFMRQLLAQLAQVAQGLNPPPIQAVPPAPRRVSWVLAGLLGVLGLGLTVWAIRHTLRNGSG